MYNFIFGSPVFQLTLRQPSALANVPRAKASDHREPEKEGVPRIDALSQGRELDVVGSISVVGCIARPVSEREGTASSTLKAQKFHLPAPIPIVSKIAHTDSELDS
jgi:hypothetical protein